MTSASKYTCPECGKEHSDWPAIAWSSPVQYNELSAEDKVRWGTLNSDLCTITGPDQDDRFIRCTMHQKVQDHTEDLDYGVWVSLSESNFNDYDAHYKDNEHEAMYFGWLCSSIPPYDDTLSIPTTVHTQKDGRRPLVVPHQDHDHPLVRDFYQGISLSEAIHRVHTALGIQSDLKGQLSD